MRFDTKHFFKAFFGFFSPGCIGCFLLCAGIGTFGYSAWAVEPDGHLFSDNVEERQDAYRRVEDSITAKLSNSKDEKERENLLMQQLVLDRLKELPDTPSQVAATGMFSEPAGKENLRWEEFEHYLNRYIEIIIDEKKSNQALENVSRQLKTLLNKLTALADDDKAANLLQLEYAYQVRKHRLLEETNRQLKETLEFAKKQYPLVLNTTRIDGNELAEEEKKLAEQRAQFQNIVDNESFTATSAEITIQQQENVLHGYAGRTLTVNEKKEMSYEQARLLALQVSRFLAASERHENNIKRLEQEQKLAWYRILGKEPNFLELSDLSGDILKQIVLLKKGTSTLQRDMYNLEKELAVLRSNTEFTGPQTRNLVQKIEPDMRQIFSGLALIDQKADALDHRGWLLNRAIDLKQTGLGAVVTKTREATGNVYQRILFVLRYPFVAYSGVTISLLVLIQVAVIIALGLLLNKFYGRIISRMGQQRSWGHQTTHILRAAGKYPLFFIIAMIVLSLAGVNTKSFAMIAGALSVGIGFGMKTIVNNLVSGIILLFDKSIRPGDFISLGGGLGDGGLRGNVVQMNIRATVLQTNDNINIIIPNADLMESQVVNWTYSDDRVRFKIPFSTAYGTDADQVKKVVKEALMNTRIVLKRPEPSVFMSAHGDSGVAYVASAWVEGPNTRQPVRTRDAILTSIYKALYAHHIEIPFPQMDVHLRNVPGHNSEQKMSVLQENVV